MCLIISRIFLLKNIDLEALKFETNSQINFMNIKDTKKIIDEILLNLIEPEKIDILKAYQAQLNADFFKIKKIDYVVLPDMF